MNTRQFLHAAKLYSQEGSSVMDQFDSVMMNEFEDLNPNALKCICKVLDLLHKYGVDDAESIKEGIEEYTKGD